MTKITKERWLIFSLFILLTLFYLWGTPSVPFHPDESTQIFMSNDLDLLIQDPASLVYTPDKNLTIEMRYRAIDAPLTRYLIGAARLVTKSPPLTTDWDWSLDWEDNISAGAYPGESDLLILSRIFPVILLVSSTILFFFAVKKVVPLSAAIIAVLLLGFNPLILLHARRAMAEAALLFGICFFIWVSTRDKINPWLIGISLAVSFNAKQSGIFLLPVGIIAVALNLDEQNHLRNLLTRWTIVLGSIIASTFLLNPYYWKAPVSAFQTGVNVRSQLIEAQVNDFLGGNQLTFAQKIISLINNLYLSRPVFAEANNYDAALKPMIDVYQGFFLHRGYQGFIWGSIQLVFAGIGVYLLLKRITNYSTHIRRSLLLLLLSTISTAAGIIFAFQLPWQRYIIPLIPFSTFWMAYGISPLFEYLSGFLQKHYPVNTP